MKSINNLIIDRGSILVLAINKCRDPYNEVFVKIWSPISDNMLIREFVILQIKEDEEYMYTNNARS